MGRDWEMRPSGRISRFKGPGPGLVLVNAGTAYWEMPKLASRECLSTAQSDAATIAPPSREAGSARAARLSSFVRLHVFRESCNKRKAAEKVQSCFASHEFSRKFHTTRMQSLRILQHLEPPCCL